MDNIAWLIFSFSVPSKLQGFRVKIWRKLNALGALQIKNSIYVLPASDHHQEQLTWTAKETDEQGGEALIIARGELLNFPDAQIRAGFARARDDDYRSLEDEVRAHLGISDAQEVLPGIRKFEKKLEALRSIDFFPSGKGEALARLLDEVHRNRGVQPPKLTVLDPEQYRGKIWVTRANPYVDRLASFWLVRRLIDETARISFLRHDEPIPSDQDHVLFDMVEAHFTHAYGLVTFEVVAESFGLAGVLPARMRQVLKSIDLEEFETAPEETIGVKRLLDGLVLTNPDDHVRTEQALGFFDTLLASYTNKKDGKTK